MKGTKSNAKKADNKLAVKKTAAPKAAATKKGKQVKDPNKPKRPASAFFVFMEDFRKQYKEKHPNNKSVSAVGKAAGEKWKSMSDEDKRPYVAKAEKRKTEYEKSMKVYNKRQTEGTKDEEDDSDKSKSEIHDDEDEEEEDSEEEDDDDE